MAHSGRTSVRLYWTGLIIVVGLLSVYVQRRGLFDLYHSYVDSRETVGTLESRLESTERERATLQREIEDLDNDPLEMEAAIRESKRYVREGETVFRVELPEERGR